MYALRIYVYTLGVHLRGTFVRYTTYIRHAPHGVPHTQPKCYHPMAANTETTIPPQPASLVAICCHPRPRRAPALLPTRPRCPRSSDCWCGVWVGRQHRSPPRAVTALPKAMIQTCVLSACFSRFGLLVTCALWGCCDVAGVAALVAVGGCVVVVCFGAATGVVGWLRFLGVCVVCFVVFPSCFPQLFSPVVFFGGFLPVVVVWCWWVGCSPVAVPRGVPVVCVSGSGL